MSWIITQLKRFLSQRRPKEHRQRPAVQAVLMTGKCQLKMPFKRLQEAA